MEVPDAASPWVPHPQGLRLVELFEHPEALEDFAVNELEDVLRSEYAHHRQPLTPGRLCGDVCMGWAGEERKTGAAFISNDKKALWLTVGFEGVYALRILAEDEIHTLREEEETVLKLLKREGGNDIDWTSLSQNFRNFVDRVRARQEIRRAHPIGEWIAQIKSRILSFL